MKKRDKEPTGLEMDFGKALRRFAQTDPKELSDMLEETKRKGEAIDEYVEERKRSIRRGARRAPKRYGV